uniref:uncharacterized protein n=1 Tax=Myxine glutinosa TaxID=7769 RepID=UPI00358EE832
MMDPSRGVLVETCPNQPRTQRADKRHRKPPSPPIDYNELNTIDENTWQGLQHVDQQSLLSCLSSLSPLPMEPQSSSDLTLGTSLSSFLPELSYLLFDPLSPAPPNVSVNVGESWNSLPDLLSAQLATSTPCKKRASTGGLEVQDTRHQQSGSKNEAHKVYLQQLLEHSRQLSQLLETLTGDDKLGFTESDAGSPPCTGKRDREYGGREGTGSESSSESFDLVSEVLGEMTSFADLLRDPAPGRKRPRTEDFDARTIVEEIDRQEDRKRPTDHEHKVPRPEHVAQMPRSGQQSRPGHCGPNHGMCIYPEYGQGWPKDLTMFRAWLGGKRQDPGWRSPPIGQGALRTLRYPQGTVYASRCPQGTHRFCWLPCTP